MKSSSTSSQPPPPELVFAFKANWTQARTRKGLRWASRSLPPSNCAPIPSMASGTTPSRPFYNDTVILLHTLSPTLHFATSRPKLSCLVSVQSLHLSLLTSGCASFSSSRFELADVATQYIASCEAGSADASAIARLHVGCCLELGGGK